MFDSWPGEKFLIKITDVISNGIGAGLRPKQILREEKARTEARRQERLILAQAELDVESIRRGEKIVDKSGELIALPTYTDVKGNSILPSSEPYFPDIKRLTEAHVRAQNADNLQQSINLAKIALFAEEEAETKKEEPISDEDIDPDWFVQWRNRAQNFSREEMQRLWAKILSSEVQQPGTNSIHSMDFLSKMSKYDADLLYKIAHFAIGGGAIYSSAQEILNQKGLSLKNLLYLDDVGILNGVGGFRGALHQTFKSMGPEENGAKYFVVSCGKKTLVLYSDKNIQTIQFPAFMISAVGVEILDLIDVEIDTDYLHLVLAHFKTLGINKVEVGEITPSGNGTAGHVVNLREYSDFESI